MAITTVKKIIPDGLIIDGTGGVRIPTGTTGQREAVPDEGTIRVNVTTSAIEAYVNGIWSSGTFDRSGVSRTLPLNAASTSVNVIPLAAETIIENTDTTNKTITIGAGWVVSDKLTVHSNLDASFVTIIGKTFVLKDGSEDTAVTMTGRGSVYMEIRIDGKVRILDIVV